jgi:hypothetical protein
MLNTSSIRIDDRSMSILGCSNDLLNNGYHDLEFEGEYTFNSKYIEAILLRIPLDPIYLDGRKDRKVIKGSYLWSIKSFVENLYALRNMKFFLDLEGKFYKDLPRHIQRRIHETKLHVYILECDTPDEVLHYIRD